MALYTCKACSGTYSDPLPNGARYFHACAPVHNPAYDAQFTIDLAGNRIAVGLIDPTIPEMLEHPQKRDENVERKPNGTVGPKNDGPGREVRK